VQPIAAADRPAVDQAAIIGLERRAEFRFTAKTGMPNFEDAGWV
jgi:hypothetical protein